jgi:hypothetical protein
METLAERSDDVSEDDALDDDKMRRLVLKKAGADPKSVFDIESKFHAHGDCVCDGDGTDLEFEIAAEALDLPRWVYGDIYAEGGPGTGYDQSGGRSQLQ